MNTVQPDAPEVWTLFEIDPAATAAVFCFKLKAQGLGIMIGNDLNRAHLVEMLEELKNQRVANRRINLAHIDYALFLSTCYIHQAPLAFVTRLPGTTP